MGPRFPGLHDEPAATLIAASLDARVGGGGFRAITYGEHLLSHPEEANQIQQYGADLDRPGSAGPNHRFQFALTLLVYHFMAVTGPSDRVERMFRVEDTMRGWALQFKV